MTPPAAPFLIVDAQCQSSTGDIDWFPDRETPVVPDQAATLCRRCPGRAACLRWALTGGEPGIWAGTTTADRARMLKLGVDDVRSADERQSLARAKAAAAEARRCTPLAWHPEGEGSSNAYRRGCRCDGCRAANRSVRAAERAQARLRANRSGPRSGTELGRGTTSRAVTGVDVRVLTGAAA